MKCNEIKELLSLYIDSLLDESEIREVEEHLSSCDACRKEYEELKEIVDLLGKTEMAPVPDAFGFRLKKALKQERQTMIDAGTISRPSKKKNQWRIITSVAAVFAVGVLSFGFYQDILGDLPGMPGGEEQTGAKQTEEIFSVRSADTADKEKDTAGSSSDGSVVLKNQASDMDPMAKTFDSSASNDIQEDNKNNWNMTAAAPVDDSSGGTQASAYGLAAGSEPTAGDESAAADAVTESESLNGEEGFDQNVPSYSKIAPSPEECSRSINASGVERNAAAVQYYNNLIEEKLKGFDYQVLGSSYTQAGEWQFRIFIFRGKDGNTYNEEIMIIGKDGEIKVICPDEFMGL